MNVLPQTDAVAAHCTVSDRNWGAVLAICMSLFLSPMFPRDGSWEPAFQVPADNLVAGT
jgi:hypothetical protein